MAADTRQVLEHHLASLIAGDLDGLMEDYAHDAVMMSNLFGVLVGSEPIREVLAKIRVTGFSVAESYVHGDFAMVVWGSDGVRLGSDTFVVRDGQIVLQTGTIERSGS